MKGRNGCSPLLLASEHETGDPKQAAAAISKGLPPCIFLLRTTTLTQVEEAGILWDNHSPASEQVPSTLQLVAPQGCHFPAASPRLCPPPVFIKPPEEQRHLDVTCCSIMVALICCQPAGDTRLPGTMRRAGKKGGLNKGTRTCMISDCFADGFFHEGSYSCKGIVEFADATYFENLLGQDF